MKSIIQRLYPFLRWCPGALGILLRQKTYPRILAACGRGVIFGRFVDLFNPGGIHIGENVVISNRCRIAAGNTAEREHGVFIDEDVFVGIGTSLKVYDGSIRLQKGCNLGSGCCIAAHGVTEFGPYVLMAAYCSVGGYGAPGHAAQHGPVIIEEDVWLGAKCRVRGPSHIGRGVIVGAHAHVAGSVPRYAIVTGDPARIKRYRGTETC